MTRMQIAQILKALTIALATEDMKAMASTALVIEFHSNVTFTRIEI